jgi:cell division protease FtsH
MAEITVALGGRASEEIMFNEVTTGAHSDIKVVTEKARMMVTRFGMSEQLGHLTFGRPHEQIFLGRDITEEKDYSEATAVLIDAEVRKIVDDCYKESKDMLSKHKGKLKKLADLLLQKEVLNREEVEEIVGIKKKKRNEAKNPDNGRSQPDA